MMMDLMSNSVGLLMLHRPQHRLNFLKGLDAVNSLEGDSGAVTLQAVAC
jgi:hypothetical protein